MDYNRLPTLIFRAMRAGKEHIIKQTGAQSDYTDRNKSATSFYHEGGQTSTENKTAGTFTRRIGNTVYRVNVHYSTTNKETVNDKIVRLVKNDIPGKAVEY